MALTTPCIGIVYPQDVDLINVARDFQRVAVTVDSAFCTVQGDLDGKVSKGGDTMSGLLTLGTQAPTATRHALSKGFGDQFYLQVDGGNGMKADLTMNNWMVTGLGPPTNDHDAVRKIYVDGNFVNRDGSVAMSGALDMGGHGVTNLAPTPDGPNWAVPRDWANDTYVNEGGDSMSGPLSIPDNQLTVGGAPGSAPGIRLFPTGTIAGALNTADDISLNLRRGTGANAAGQIYIRFESGAGGNFIGRIEIHSDGNAVDYIGRIVAPSDYRLKERLGPVTDAAAKVVRLARAAYDGRWRASGREAVMLNAHDVAAVVPTAVRGEKDGDDMQGVDFTELVPLLAAALGEALDRIAALEGVA